MVCYFLLSNTCLRIAVMGNIWASQEDSDTEHIWNQRAPRWSGCSGAVILIVLKLWVVLWVVLQSLAWYFLFSLTLICLSLLASLTALSPDKLISLSYQWPARLFYFRCEKGRRAGDEMWFFLPHGSIFPSKEGSRTVACVRSVVPERTVGEQEGCNGMSGLMCHTLENPGGRKSFGSAWCRSSCHGIKSSRTSAAASQQQKSAEIWSS